MSGVSRRDLVWAVALVVLLTSVWVARGDQADAGGVPPGDGVDVVYVAVATNFPDSLGVGPGAGSSSGPIIILPTDPPIPGSSEAELVRLDPRSVVIVGGEAVISAAMETALDDLLPNAVVSRIAGADRYETNALFSQSIYPIEQWISVPAAGFRGEEPATDDVVIFSGKISVVNRTDGVLVAPVSLPDGAQILELEGAAFDLSGSPITISLEKSDREGNPTTLASVSTVDSESNQTPTTPVAGGEVVDNGAYSYFVRATSVGETLKSFYGAAVKVRLGTP